MSGLLAPASPVKQARPYPRRGSWTTRAPILEAISGVPSVELLSTTRTSVTRSDGRSAEDAADGLRFVVRGNDDRDSHLIWFNHHHGEDGHRCASRASTPHFRPARPTASASDASTGTSSSQIQAVPHSETHRLPRYRNATKATGRVSRPMTSRIPREISVIACMRSCHGGVACRQTHHCLPRGRRVTRLNVIVDQACVARWSVETLSQIFEEDPHKHCADRETDYCQPVCGIKLFSLVL